MLTGKLRIQKTMVPQSKHHSIIVSKTELKKILSFLLKIKMKKTTSYVDDK